MAVHQCANFFNNLRLVNKRAVIIIAEYLSSTSTYIYSPDVNQQLSTCGVVYNPDKEKGIECCVDADFSGRWDQDDADNAENCMPCMGYVMTYAGCPVLWCSKLQTDIYLITTELEYISLCQAMRKVIHFMELIKEVSSILMYIFQSQNYFVKSSKTTKVALPSRSPTNFHQ